MVLSGSWSCWCCQVEVHVHFEVHTVAHWPALFLSLISFNTDSTVFYRSLFLFCFCVLSACAFSISSCFLTGSGDSASQSMGRQQNMRGPPGGRGDETESATYSEQLRQVLVAWRHACFVEFFVVSVQHPPPLCCWLNLEFPLACLDSQCSAKLTRMPRVAKRWITRVATNSVCFCIKRVKHVTSKTKLLIYYTAW